MCILHLDGIPSCICMYINTFANSLQRCRSWVVEFHDFHADQQQEPDANTTLTVHIRGDDIQKYPDGGEMKGSR